MTRTLKAITGVMILKLLALGTDFVWGLNSNASGLSQYPESTPIVWGASCIITAVIGLAAIFSKNIRWLIHTAVMATAVYIMLGFEIFPHTVGNNHPDDWRFLSGYWSDAVIWVVIGLALSFRFGVYQIHKNRGGDDGSDRVCDAARCPSYN